MTISIAGVLRSRQSPGGQQRGPAPPVVRSVYGVCLAMEHRRERVAQLDLPFPARLREADLRRRRAQIAARRALGL